MSWLKILADQVFTSRKPELVITNKARKKMAAWFLRDKDITDVFYHGEEVNDQLIVRQYNGYEIGLSYFRDRKTGDAVVTAVWKR